MSLSIGPAQIAELVKGLATEVREFVQHSLSPISARQVEITKRLDMLEQRRVMTFAGPHDPSCEYSPGAVVQRSGGTWVCLLATREQPGASTAWRQISGGTR